MSLREALAGPDPGGNALPGAAMTDTDIQPKMQAAKDDLVWRLMLFGITKRQGLVAKRLGFRQTKKNPRNWWRVFDPKTEPPYEDLAAKILSDLRKVGKINTSLQQVPRQVPAAQPKSDVRTLQAMAVKEIRLADEALKRAIEKRSQAEKRAQKEIQQRAADALRRARGASA